MDSCERCKDEERDLAAASRLWNVRCSRKEPPVFSGKPLELAEWIFSMEEVLVTFPSNEHVAFSISYFTGDARRWFMSFTAESERPRSWLALKEAVELAFSPRAEKPHYLGQLLKARQNGTLEEYIESFRRLCLHAGAETSEVTRTLIFIERLDDGLRKHVKLSQPENLQAAFQAVRAIADLTPDMEGQSLSQAGVADDPQFLRNDGFGQSTLAASQAFGRASGNWKQHSGRKRFQYQKQGRCYICGRYGHFARSCRQHPKR